MTTNTAQTRWYQFRQNNSGGVFCEPAVEVWVEAFNEQHADARALEFGLYFDGVNTGVDCSCCGDRWSPGSDWNAQNECPEMAHGSIASKGSLPAGVALPLNGEPRVLPKNPKPW